MYIPRKQEKQLRKYLKSKEILALIGPRQAGKTTLLKKIFDELDDKRSTFLTFEDRDVLSLFNSDIKAFADTYLAQNKFLFIDEFQYAQKGGQKLKYLFDTYSTKIIISGSSAVDLTIEALKFLVGRVFVIELYPFDFGEFLLAKNKDYHQLYEKNRIDLQKDKVGNKLSNVQKKTLSRYFEEYAIWGGYPRVVLAKDKEEKRMVLKNIYNTYFLREVKTLMDIADDYKLEKLIKVLALQIGNIVDFSNLSNEVDIAVQTVRKYVNFLEKTYICNLVKPFFKNKRREVVKAPKNFFFDTGLRNVVVDDFRLLNNRTDGGELLENAFWMQLIKTDMKTQYWRDKNLNEVDFVLSLAESKMVAIEVKRGLKGCKKFPDVFVKTHKNIKIYCAFLEGYQKYKVEEKDIFIPLV